MTNTTDERTKFLRIYLGDHVAGATAGSQRAARLADAEANSTDGAALSTFAEDVAADLDALLTLMETMGVEPSRLKARLASVGEMVGALKPNGRVLHRSPLSTIVELEAMQMAVRGKRSLWETLQVAMPVPTPVDLDGLVARADRQLDMLSRLHAGRVASTLSPSRAERLGPRKNLDGRPALSHQPEPDEADPTDPRQPLGEPEHPTGEPQADENQENEPPA